MKASVLSCRDLEVRRASGFVLRVPSLSIGPASATAVCGPNGSGKSTLLLACAGLIELSGGQLELTDPHLPEGRAPTPLQHRRRVVLVPQDPYLLRGSVERNLSWGLKLRQVSRGEQRSRIAEVLGALAIEDLAASDAGRLSGGQRTLVAVARALVLRPGVLLLDEVTRDLDRQHREAVLDAVRGLPLHGSSVLLATHDLEIADRLAGVRIELQDGQIATGEQPSKQSQK